MHFVQCSEIWDGLPFADQDIKTKGLTASIYCKKFELDLVDKFVSILPEILEIRERYTENKSAA